MADQPIGPIPDGQLLAKALDLFVQRDGFGLCNVRCDAVPGNRRLVGRVENGQYAQQCLGLDADGNETRPAFDQPAVFGHPRDRGDDAGARENLGRRAQTGCHGVEPVGRGVGMVGTAPAHERFFDPKPLQGGPIEEYDFQFVVEHIERLLGRVQQPCQFGGMHALLGHWIYRRRVLRNWNLLYGRVTALCHPYPR